MRNWPQPLWQVAVGKKQFIYDPENAPEDGLEPGKLYSGEQRPRGVWALERSEAKAIEVSGSDLILQRNKPADRLEIAAANMAYEAAMLSAAFLSHANRFAYTSWFVHFRNLWKSLSGKGHETDEVCAQDFFTSPRDWHEARRAFEKPQDLSTYCAAADELAAHLSYNRNKEIYQGVIPNPGITRFVLRVYGELQRKLPSEKVQWFTPAPILGEANSE
jgi:hypothetical protein